MKGPEKANIALHKSQPITECMLIQCVCVMYLKWGENPDYGYTFNSINIESDSIGNNRLVFRSERIICWIQLNQIRCNISTITFDSQMTTPKKLFGPDCEALRNRYITTSAQVGCDNEDDQQNTTRVTMRRSPRRRCHNKDLLQLINSHPNDVRVLFAMFVALWPNVMAALIESENDETDSSSRIHSSRLHGNLWIARVSVQICIVFMLS